jgi:hypothetical protein
MGTDVHGIWQAKKNGKWHDVESTWDQSRHYFLFSWLAGVRNGFGFAGVTTYDPIKPISEPRGLPDDFEGGEEHPVADPKVMGRRAEYIEPGESPVMWMGDHSHSWLTADEILAAERPGSIARTGVVTRAFYDAWDGKTPPESWSGGVSGRDIIVATAPNVPKEATHVRIKWTQSDAGLDYFVDEVRRLKELHGNVRLVFGFDS